MKKENKIPRRATLKGMGAAGALTVINSKRAFGKEVPHTNPDVFHCSSDIRKEIFNKVFSTMLIDTHEHIIEEKGRFSGTSHRRVKSDDWSILLSHYLNSDMLTAGMPKKESQHWLKWH